ncbi:hypothetical protein EG028_21670 [Chitinophaga barathri]|uniref:Uncharacterized protein n=1 Tax=Chitinophaga barathri TaxID=1647451 RepID=A0A3N4MUU6_9BACT|nr:hypothetical protein EG028_21670 [Chitinophaga barathri]
MQSFANIGDIFLSWFPPELILLVHNSLVQRRPGRRLPVNFKKIKLKAAGAYTRMANGGFTDTNLFP